METEQYQHYVVEVREYESKDSDPAFHEVDCKRTSYKQAERVESGMQHNLNHERFYTRITTR